jgi:hypothetical protein
MACAYASHVSTGSDQFAHDSHMSHTNRMKKCSFATFVCQVNARTSVEKDGYELVFFCRAGFEEGGKQCWETLRIYSIGTRPIC